MQKLKAGFTLIELMIVVAIIGLLAALAIPNFIKFQARSKQAEGRTNLKAIFTAQKSYYGDKQMYLESADVIGFTPEFNNRYSYFTGTQNGQTRTTAPGVLNPLTSTGILDPSCTSVTGFGHVTVDESKYGATVTAVPVAPAVGARTVNSGSPIPGMTVIGVSPTGAPGTGCCPGGQCEFVAAAAGNIDNDSVFDSWSISSQPGLSGTVTCQGAGASTGAYSQFASGEPVNECNDVQL